MHQRCCSFAGRSANKQVSELAERKDTNERAGINEQRAEKRLEVLFEPSTTTEDHSLVPYRTYCRAVPVEQLAGTDDFAEHRVVDRELVETAKVSIQHNT